MELQSLIKGTVASKGIDLDSSFHDHWAASTISVSGNLASPNQRVIYLGSADLGDALVYACEAFIGTGGGFPWHIEGDSLFELAPTGAAIRIHITSSAPSKAEVAHSAIHTVSDQVAAIKAAFGLSISQLAAVLNVKRPTIYSWFDADKGPAALRSANKERLSILARLADEWNKRSATPPAQFLTAAIAAETSLLDLLSAPALNEIAIQKVFEAIVERSRGNQDTKKSSFGDEMRAKGFAAAPSMRR